MSTFDIDSLLRCHYRDSAGRRCRLPRQQSDSTFCTRHALARRGGRPAEHGSGDPAPDFSAELLGPINDFRSATSINYTLGRLLILKAAGGISAKDASVVAYICQLLFQTIPYVRKEMSWSRGQSPEDAYLRNVLQATSSIWDSEDTPKTPGAPGATGSRN